MKIAIVGSAPATCDLAPWNDPSWEMWTLAWRDAPRVSVMFEMHAPATWHYHGGDDYRARLAKVAMPIYLLQALPDLPTSIAYPAADVLADLAPEGSECDFFTSSLAYALALAVTQKPEEIGLFGADMSAEEEYGYQRPAMTYLVGLARGRGIKVTVPPASPLLRANFTYGGYAGPDGAFAKATGITEELLTKRISAYEKDRSATQIRLNNEIARMNTLDGSISESRALLEAVHHFNRGGVIS